MKKILALVFFGVALVGCPKRTATTVSGTDEEMLDRYASRLEELRVSVQAESPSCDDVCSMRSEVCDIAQKVCEIAQRNPDRGTERCVAANEDCARFNDSCASCSG